VLTWDGSSLVWERSLTTNKKATVINKITMAVSAFFFIIIELGIHQIYKNTDKKQIYPIKSN
jgi:preprotein translocase subunit SecG